MPALPESWKYHIKEIKPTGNFRHRVVHKFWSERQYVVLQIEQEIIREHMFYKDKRKSELEWRDASVNDYARLIREQKI